MCAGKGHNFSEVVAEGEQASGKVVCGVDLFDFVA
jgi:hypothetical protein